jgi:hypothetical protein
MYWWSNKKGLEADGNEAWAKGVRVLSTSTFRRRPHRSDTNWSETPTPPKYIAAPSVAVSPDRARRVQSIAPPYRDGAKPAATCLGQQRCRRTIVVARRNFASIQRICSVQRTGENQSIVIDTTVNPIIINGSRGNVDYETIRLCSLVMLEVVAP